MLVLFPGACAGCILADSGATASCHRFLHSRHDASDGVNTFTYRVAVSPHKVTLTAPVMIWLARPAPPDVDDVVGNLVPLFLARVPHALLALTEPGGC